MQNNSVLVTKNNLVEVKQIFKQQHVTHVANSSIFLTEETVYVAANNTVLHYLENETCISNILYN